MPCDNAWVLPSLCYTSGRPQIPPTTFTEKFTFCTPMHMCACTHTVKELTLAQIEATLALYSLLYILKAAKTFPLSTVCRESLLLTWCNLSLTQSLWFPDSLSLSPSTPFLCILSQLLHSWFLFFYVACIWILILLRPRHYWLMKNTYLRHGYMHPLI